MVVVVVGVYVLLYRVGWGGINVCVIAKLSTSLG